MENSRTSNSVKNSMTSMIANVLAIIISFISQTFFIKILGSEYLGLNGLFSNVFKMLGLFELGIGSAIVYNMYRPIAENDIEKIKSLVVFYKKAYNIIAIVVTLVGLILMPFIPYFVKDLTIDVNINIIYILMLMSTVSSYLLTYKRNMLYASQKSYIINVVHCGYLILLNFFQIIVLYVTKNYYLYLVLKIIFQLLENIILTIICNKKYPYLLEKCKKLDAKSEKAIFKKVRALMFHRIGEIIVFGTDNLIISRYLGVVIVGLYSNYTLIINAVSGLFNKVLSSITASVGNLIVEGNEKKIFDIFKKARFINYWITCFTAVSLFLIINPFIKIWIGEEYVLSWFTTFILIVNYYQNSERTTFNVFKNSAGIWEQDKFVPLVESIINIIMSIILVKYIGLSGVFIGTIISGLVLWLYSYPKFVYHNLFHKKYKHYFIETFLSVVVFSIVLIISTLFSYYLSSDNIILNLIINTLISLIIPNIIIIIIYHNTDEFKYSYDLLKKIIKKCLRCRNN